MILILSFFLVYHTYSYDNRFQSVNNNTIQYNKSGNTCFGIITNFLQADQVFCIIKKLEIVRSSNVVETLLSDACKKHLSRFFVNVNESTSYDIIKLEMFVKCILIRINASDIMLTPCLDLDESD